jgi:formate/nitrite transporter FocA (FNT family)
VATEPSYDALVPPELVAKTEVLGVSEAQLPAPKMFVLAMLAGAFIALGRLFWRRHLDRRRGAAVRRPASGL